VRCSWSLASFSGTRICDSECRRPDIEFRIWLTGGRTAGAICYASFPILNMLQTKYLNLMSKSELSQILIGIKKKLMLRNFDEDVSNELQDMLKDCHKIPHRRNLSLQTDLKSSSSGSSLMSLSSRERKKEDAKLWSISELTFKPKLS
jgi:hypothetical protein